MKPGKGVCVLFLQIPSLINGTMKIMEEKEHVLKDVPRNNLRTTISSSSNCFQNEGWKFLHIFIILIQLSLENGN